MCYLNENQQKRPQIKIIEYYPLHPIVNRGQSYKVDF